MSVDGDQDGFQRHSGVRPWRRWLAERARQRDRERTEVELRGDIRWWFENACAGTPLGRMIYTASGVTTSVPKVGHIDLGPPVTILVQARLGQTVDDFKAAAPRIAAALKVNGIVVTPRSENWMRIVLLTDPPGAGPRAE